MIQNILDQTRIFLDNHAELVILKLNHFCGTGANDDTFVDMVNNTLGPRLFTEDGTESELFINRPLKSIIPPSDKTGKVVVLYDGSLQDSPANRAMGLFPHSLMDLAHVGGAGCLSAMPCYMADSRLLEVNVANLFDLWKTHSWAILTTLVAVELAGRLRSHIL